MAVARAVAAIPNHNAAAKFCRQVAPSTAVNVSVESALRPTPWNVTEAVCVTKSPKFHGAQACVYQLAKTT